ncbi:hypothetical protein ACWGAN_28505, partial [Streptomyces sp. NPDC054945]
MRSTSPPSSENRRQQVVVVEPVVVLGRCRFAQNFDGEWKCPRKTDVLPDETPELVGGQLADR